MHSEIFITRAYIRLLSGALYRLEWGILQRSQRGEK